MFKQAGFTILHDDIKHYVFPESDSLNLEAMATYVLRPK